MHSAVMFHNQHVRETDAALLPKVSVNNCATIGASADL